MEPVPKKRYHEGTSSRGTEVVSKSEDSGGGLWKSKSKNQSQALKKMTYPNHGYAKKQIPLHPASFGSEKPNASSHRNPHWFQQRNHMSNETNSAASKIGLEAQPSDVTRVAEERIKVAIHPEFPEQTIAIGSTLTEEGRKELCDLVRRNLDIFAWKPVDMTSVSRYIAEHRLNVQEGCQPVSWRMCVDFKDLNKACPKDGYPLLEIDWKEGMFLGYKVNTKGIKVCPDKVEAFLGLPSLKCLKDVQRLNGKLASLKRFLAKSTKKSLPFFKTLKKCTKKSDFHWTTEAKATFRQMKKQIAELPMLTVPTEKEELIVYLAAAREVASAVLMTERESKQMLIYFVSRALQGPEINYTPIEKLVLAMVHASKQLKRFDAINNEAEYEALIACLRITEQMGVKFLQTHVDFRLVANQINRSYIAKEPVEESKEKSIIEAEVLKVEEEEGNT
ncbi:reverse transcriptase domain-containing protein [Tanacetum coccineum]